MNAPAVINNNNSFSSSKRTVRIALEITANSWIVTLTVVSRRVRSPITQIEPIAIGRSNWLFAGLLISASA